MLCKQETNAKGSPTRGSSVECLKVRIKWLIRDCKINNFTIARRPKTVNLNVACMFAGLANKSTLYSYNIYGPSHLPRLIHTEILQVVSSDTYKLLAVIFSFIYNRVDYK
jgi:hypothetical protein